MDKFPLLYGGRPLGELTAEREALYTWFDARCVLPGEGLWCAWAVGDQGELHLMTRPGPFRLSDSSASPGSGGSAGGAMRSTPLTERGIRRSDGAENFQSRSNYVYQIGKPCGIMAAERPLYPAPSRPASPDGGRAGATVRMPDQFIPAARRTADGRRRGWEEAV